MNEYIKILSTVAGAQMDLMDIEGYDEDVYQALESAINEIEGKISELEGQ